MLDATVGENIDGDLQKELDLFADRAFERAISEASVRAFVSEERDGVTELAAKGAFLVALDPLYGSSNIETNITIGAIFRVLDALETRHDTRSADAAVLDDAALSARAGGALRIRDQRIKCPTLAGANLLMGGTARVRRISTFVGSPR